MLGKKERAHLFAHCPTFAKKVVLIRRIRWFEDSNGSPSFQSLLDDLGPAAPRVADPRLCKWHRLGARAWPPIGPQAFAIQSFVHMRRADSAEAAGAFAVDG
jgi:hypothetical protein